MQQNIWFTPEGIEDLLPEQAEKLEYYRQTLLKEFNLSGYQLVLPPIAEFTDSLLTGTGRKLATDTCRFTDHESGRMMGVRADMTPQVARIVSNRIQSNDIVRLCYVGEVLKSRNNKAKGSRSPIQLGAELFGHSGIDSDIEIIELMLSTASLLQLGKLKLSLGHVGLVQALMDWIDLAQDEQVALVDILKRKALPEYHQWLQQQANLTSQQRQVFEALPAFCGDASEVLAAAKSSLQGINALINQCLSDLETLVSYITTTLAINMHLDLSDLRGFQYHTGIIFACYHDADQPTLIAKGGRYDEVCSAFGAQHPATGFSFDLRNLLDHLPSETSQVDKQVYAPINHSKALFEKIRSLRAEGVRVIRCYQPERLAAGSSVLVENGDQWEIKSN